MTSFAKDTSVSVERTKAEIEKIVAKFGADGFASAWQKSQNRALIEFVMNNRQIRFVLELPDIDSDQFRYTPSGRERSGGAQAIYKAWEQECRSLWRGLFLSIKGKLVAVDNGVHTFEQEFLSHIVIDKGARTIGEAVIPQIEAASAGTGRLMIGMDS